MKRCDWLIVAMWLSTSNQSALFQSEAVFYVTLKFHNDVSSSCIKIGRSRPLFHYFRLFNTINSKLMFYHKSLPKTGFEPQTSENGSNKQPLYLLNHYRRYHTFTTRCRRIFHVGTSVVHSNTLPLVQIDRFLSFRTGISIRSISFNSPP